MLVELWGYLSMVVVVISMLMKNIRVLRVVNTISCGMFVVYGILISSMPVVLLNSIVILINLLKLKRGE